jgi:hypothetical protein
MGRKLPFRCSVRLHSRVFRPFSDSLGRGILGSSDAGSCIDLLPRDARMASEPLHAAWASLHLVVLDRYARERMLPTSP